MAEERYALEAVLEARNEAGPEIAAFIGELEYAESVANSLDMAAELTLSTASAREELESFRAELQTLTTETVDLELNTSPARGELGAFRAELASVSEEARLGLDTSQARGELGAFRSELSSVSDEEVRLTLETGAARGELQGFKGELSGIQDEEVRLTLETSGARAEAASFSASLSGISDEEVRLELETGRATAAAAAFRTSLAGIPDETVRLTLEGTERGLAEALAFAASLKAIPDEKVTLELDVDGLPQVAAASTAVTAFGVASKVTQAAASGLETALTGIPVVGRLIAGAVQLASGVMTAAGASAGGLAVAVVGATVALAAFLAVAIALEFAVTVVGVAFSALVGSMLAVGSAGAVLVAGFGLIGAAAYRMVQGVKDGEVAFQGLRSSLDTFRSAFSTAFEAAATRLASFSARLLDVGSNVMPTLGTAADTAVQAMISGFDSAISKIRETGVTAQSLQTVLDAVPGVVSNVTSAVVDMGAGLLNVLGAAVPSAQDLSRWIADTAEKFRAWSETEGAREKIREFLSIAADVAPAVGRAILEIGDALTRVEPGDVERVVSAVEKLGQAADIARIAVETLATAGSAGFQILAAVATGELEKIPGIVANAYGEAKSAAESGSQGVTDATRSGMSGAPDAALDALTGVTDAVTTTTEEAAEAAQSGSAEVPATVASEYGRTPAEAAASLSGLTPAVLVEFHNANAAAANSTAEMVSIVTQNMEVLRNNVQVGMQGASEAVSEGFEDMVSTAGDMSADVTASAEDMASGVVSAANTMSSGTIDAAQTMSAGVIAATATMAAGAIDNANRMADGVIAAANRAHAAMLLNSPIPNIHYGVVSHFSQMTDTVLSLMDETERGIVDPFDRAEAAVRDSTGRMAGYMSDLRATPPGGVSMDPVGFVAPSSAGPSSGATPVPGSASSGAGSRRLEEKLDAIVERLGDVEAAVDRQTRELPDELAPVLSEATYEAQESPEGQRIQARNRNRSMQRFLDKRGG